MRPQFLIFILIVVLLMAALLFWRRPVQPAVNREQPRATVQTTNVPTAANTVTQKAANAMLPALTTNQHRSFATNHASLNEMIEQEVESRNKPVDFYGMVIDQNSNAISGVKIKSGVRHWKNAGPEFGYVGATTVPLETITGADGRFELTGATGDVFGVLLYKDGYEAESEKNGFGTGGSYSYANPVIFKMWSTNIHEKLITGSYAFQIVPDGRPYFINLPDGTINESGTGNLKVWILYTNQVVVPHERYNWSAGIDVINGGLQDASDDAMWMAPANGYVPSFQQSGKIRGGQRGQIGERRFYLKLQNENEYGHMTIDLLAPFNAGIPGLVRLSYAINPSGSRILR